MKEITERQIIEDGTRYVVVVTSIDGTTDTRNCFAALTFRVPPSDNTKFFCVRT